MKDLILLFLALGVFIGLVIWGATYQINKADTNTTFHLVGQVEGCNVYHQHHTYGGSTFAVCHK